MGFNSGLKGLIKETGTRKCIYKTGKVHQRRKPGDCTSFCVIELGCTRQTKSLKKDHHRRPQKLVLRNTIMGQETKNNNLL
jgi:hypothetical protein